MSRTVLIVDADPDQHVLFGDVLSSMGYHVLHARSADEALELARAWRLDLIVTDVRLPVVSGKEMVEEFRADDGPNTVPVVVITADVFARQMDPAFVASVSAWLHKPCPPTRAAAVVRQVLGEEREAGVHALA